VIARDPKHAGALSSLGRVEFLQKHYAEALELLGHAVASDDSLREAHYYLGLTYSRLGQKSESDREFQRATQLEREDTEKRKTLWNKLDLPATSAR